MLDVSLDSTNFYFLIAVFQGIVLSLIIAIKKPRNTPNVLFGALLFLLSLSLLHLVLEHSIQAFSARYPIPMSYGFAFAPIAYLHIIYIRNPLRKFKKKDLLQFLPTVIFDAIAFPLAFSYIWNHQEWANQNVPFIQGMSLRLEFVLAIQFIVYIN